MKCEEVTPLLNPLIDNELPTQNVALIMEHIQTCHHCQDSWDTLAAIRDRLHTFNKSIAVPGDLLSRIDQRVEQSSRSSWRSTELWTKSRVAAIAALAILAASYFSFVRFKQAHVPTSVNEIVATLSGSHQAGVSPAEGLSQLSKQAGFPILVLELPGYHFKTAQLVKIPGKSLCVVRLAYETTQNGKPVDLYCYQACQGQIKYAGLNEHHIDGRLLCCGQVGKYSVVYWPGKGLDHVLVSSLSEHDLMALAMRA